MSWVNEGTIITVDGERYVSVKDSPRVCSECAFFDKKICDISCGGVIYRKLNWKKFLLKELKKLEEV